MNIIVGLGNAGSRYEQTRHNVGFEIIDNLSKVLECPKFSTNKKLFAETCKLKETIFLKPNTFMNESGKAVGAVLHFYGLKKFKKSSSKSKDVGGHHNVFVIHDDLDLPLGTYKIQYATGPKGHNGLLSIYQHLGTQNFWHVRVGIDSRQGDRTVPPQTYVLQKFTPQETEKINQVKINLVKELVQKI